VVAQAFTEVLLAALAALLVLRVRRVADTGQAWLAAFRPLLWVGFGGAVVVFGLLLYLRVYSAAGFSLPSTLLVAAHPLSCLWGVGLVAKLLGKGKRALGYPTTLVQAAACSPLSKVTVDTFLGFLPPSLGGHYQYLRNPVLEAPVGGSVALAAPTSPLLGINAWFAGSFRRDVGLRLHVAAFVSLLLSVPGLLLHFLGSLPWKAVSGTRVSLTLLFAFAPLALALEFLFSYAGLSHIRFNLHGGHRLTLVVRVKDLRAVVRLASEGSLGSNVELAKFLQRTGGGPRGQVRADFFCPLEPTAPGRAPCASLRRRG
jgi:hypothetical protein